MYSHKKKSKAFGNAKNKTNKTKAFLNASTHKLKQKKQHTPKQTKNKTQAILNAYTQKYKIKQPKKHHITNQQKKITTLLKIHIQKKINVHQTKPKQQLIKQKIHNQIHTNTNQQNPT